MPINTVTKLWLKLVEQHVIYAVQTI